MKKEEIKTNRRFGRLIIIEESASVNKVRMFKCKCDCGNECNVTAISLRSGHTISCGCLKSRGENKISNILSLCSVSRSKLRKPTIVLLCVLFKF